MASPNTAEQKKQKSSDGLTIEPPTPVRPFEGLIMAPTTLTDSSSGRNDLPKHNLCNYSDGLRIALPTPAAAGQHLRPKMSAFQDLIRVSTSHAESSSHRNHLPYDVFINHYGQDTKHTLAKSIYQKLNVTGLRVFLDTPELDFGDFFPPVLENAIANAPIHKAIFSKNYAKSPWCLEELAFMLSLQPKVIFIPIFYYVEPYILRWAIERKGIYADAFYEYEKKSRYNTQKLQSWKVALHEASLYIGQIINKAGDEEVTLMNVVNHVLKELKKVRLDVARHPVGLDKVEEDFHKNIVLQPVEGSIQIVSIWGMGGIGKTTLAKHLYNKKCSTIKRSSFLFDIRKAASKGQLHEKQKKLLQDLNLKDESANFDNMDEGKEILKSRLRFASVLIVLDDVDHEDQLDALLPERDSLGPGSLIIVTTRELYVLKRWGISAIYKINPLNRSYAKELFSWHAFEQPSPFIDFKELAEKFIDACCGLPLSLKVLGSLLHGESNKEYWQSQLDKLSRIVPEDIKSRLRISYNALDEEEKEMFLDVACFFIGWPSSRAIAIWDGSMWSGLHGWQRLTNKCLVELGEDNHIKMHDHLKDLGREIANKQSPYRLWSKQQIIKIQPQQESIQIRGMAGAFGENCSLRHDKIILNTSEGERILALRSLGMKIFIGEGDFINDECGEFSRELLCFHCVRFAHKNLPSWLPLKKLRILNILKPQNLEDLWECDEDAPPQLRQLIIDKGFELKEISHLQGLRSLETLRIVECGELKTLPSLAGATSLKEIELRRCIKLEKIESLESLRSLETLQIYSCGDLKEISHLQGLRSLETLRISGCGELKTLPSLGGATSLKEIELRWCTKLEKIESLESLRSLETLQIYNCTELKTLPSLAEATSLKKIDLIGCFKLDILPSLGELTCLEEFEKKWPREVIICTRAVIDEMSLRNFFTSLPEVVDSATSNSYGDLTVCMPESTDNANAILIFNEGSIWVWMGIFPQQSTWLLSPEYRIMEVEEAWIMRGREQSTRQAFTRLCQR